MTSAIIRRTYVIFLSLYCYNTFNRLLIYCTRFLYSLSSEVSFLSVSFGMKASFVYHFIKTT